MTSREAREMTEAHPEPETCDRCGDPITAEALALGWPVAVTPEDGDPATDEEYVCPDCYGDEAYCPAGEHLLSGTSDSRECAACDAPAVAEPPPAPTRPVRPSRGRLLSDDEDETRARRVIQRIGPAREFLD